jgi:hypothetical protein
MPRRKNNIVIISVVINTPILERFFLTKGQICPLGTLKINALNLKSVAHIAGKFKEIIVSDPSLVVDATYEISDLSSCICIRKNPLSILTQLSNLQRLTVCGNLTYMVSFLCFLLF